MPITSSRKGQIRIDRALYDYELNEIQAATGEPTYEVHFTFQKGDAIVVPFEAPTLDDAQFELQNENSDVRRLIATAQYAREHAEGKPKKR